MYNLNWLRETLPEDITLKYYPEIHSTNSEALRLIEADTIADSTILLTGNQTAGRGRLQRTWVSDPADSLTFSLVLRDSENIPADNPAFLTLVAGAAVCDAIADLAGMSPQVKWPNDILLNDKKACGILTESIFDPPSISGVVIGIGVNVGKNAVPPRDQMRYPATSIAQETGAVVQREELLVRILQKLVHWIPLAASPSFRSHYQNRLAFMGESVNIVNEVNQTSVMGICAGITPSGALILNSADGKAIEIHAGEVSLKWKPEE